MYKIIKQINSYQQSVINFEIYERFLWKWRKSKIFPDNYETYELAEKSIIKKFNSKHNGIIEIDNNVYKFHAYSLPLP